MNLTTLVAQEKWQEFDEAWNRLIAGGGAIDELLQALRLAGEKKRLPRCVPLVRQHADALAAAGRAVDAARLVGVAVHGGGAPGELAPALFEHARAAWSEKPWWPVYTEIAGLRPDSPDPRRAWTAFERLVWLEVGRLVYHAGGWGVGEVVEVLPEAGEVGVRFGNGRRDRFPLTAAIEIFEPLPDEDLRALHFRDPEALKKKLKQEPVEILHAIVARHHGRASVVGIKNALLQVGIEGSAWSSWWRRARKLAESSEWFRVIGTPAKGEIHLLYSATDPVEDLKRGISQLATLQDLYTRVRDQLIGGGADDRMRAMLLDVLEERAGGGEPTPVRLAAWLLLREARGVPGAPLTEALTAAANAPAPDDPSKPPALWALFQSVQGAREQERCVLALQDVYGERWQDEAIANLQHAPPGMVRALVDALYAAGRAGDLATHYKELLARPLRAPEALLALARLVEAGKLPGEMPSPLQRAQGLLTLATNLHVNRRGDAASNRLQMRLVEFLTKGREPVLRRLLADADADALLSVQRMLQRGVDETLDHLVTDVVMRAAPAPRRQDQASFWEGEHIWTTKRGLEKRRAELRHLMEVKIPENQDAIGRAASMGDLSENSEWEMAIQEQRNLTSRAAEMETELRRVDLIDDALLYEGVVSPGTTVRYREVASGTENEITILGPWDTDRGEQVVSYRAPLAAGLLGRRAGDRATLALPSGQLEVEILSAKPVHFD